MRWILGLVIAVGCSSSDRARVESVRPDFAAYEEGPPLELGTAWLLPADLVIFDGAAPRVPAAKQTFTAGCEARWTISGPAGSRELFGAEVTVDFAEPGRYQVTARCDGVVRRASVKMCDFAAVIREAASYYGSSIDFTRVRIEHGPTLSGASWVAHDKVHINDGMLDVADGCPPAELYVHELGHVWEHQHGMYQLLRGALDQLEHALVGDVYDFGGPPSIRRALEQATGFDGFNLEQIAEIFATDFAMKRRGIDDDYARDLAALTKSALAKSPPTAAPPP